MAFVVVQRIANFLAWKKSRAIKLLGIFSMPIYLFHQQIVYLFLYWLNGRIQPLFHAIINFIGAMGISLLLSLILMRFKKTRFLLGEK